MQLTLFYAPQTCATVPYITLTEAGAEFDVTNINNRSGQNTTPEFLAINPKHKVPVLMIDGEPLTENIAIQIWIARQFRHAQLLPDESHEEIKAISLMSWFASGIHPRLTPNMRPQNYCDLPSSEESVKRVANKLLFEEFTLADKLLAGREWFGSHFSAVDAYFFWCFKRALSFKLDLKGFSNCAAHYKRMLPRPSVQKLLAHEKMVMEQFAR